METPVASISAGSFSRFFGAFRWLFMPLGLLALVAVGIHAAADVVDDRLLRAVEALDVWLDGLLAQHESTAAWVNRIDSRERTLIARGFALAWELLTDFFIALPMLGYDEPEQTTATRTFTLVAKETWKDLFSRLNQQPTPMRIGRPIVTAIFVMGGAFAVARLVESTIFVGLVGHGTTAEVSGWVARVAAGTAMAMLVFSHCWRSVWRALQHADAASVKARHPWLAGLRGTLVAAPLALFLLLEAEVLLSFFR